MGFRFARFGALALIVAAALAIAGAGAAHADDAQIRRGEYLARIMDCTGCHTPGTMVGQPDMAKYLAGGDVGFYLPGLGIFWPPNLTADADTGLGGWSDAEIILAVRTGERPDGRILAPIMPYMSYAALSDEDAAALVTYLRTLPHVANKVPEPVAGPDDAVGAYMLVVIPGQ